MFTTCSYTFVWGEARLLLSLLANLFVRKWTCVHRKLNFQNYGKQVVLFNSIDGIHTTHVKHAAMSRWLKTEDALMNEWMNVGCLTHRYGTQNMMHKHLFNNNFLIWFWGKFGIDISTKTDWFQWIFWVFDKFDGFPLFFCRSVFSCSNKYNFLKHYDNSVEHFQRLFHLRLTFPPWN